MIHAVTKGEEYIVSGETQSGMLAVIQTQEKMQRLSLRTPTVFLIYLLARHYEIRNGM